MGEWPLLRPRSSPARGQQCTGSPRLPADLENVVPLPIGKPSLGPGAACPRLCGDWREKSVDSTPPPRVLLPQACSRARTMGNLPGGRWRQCGHRGHLHGDAPGRPGVPCCPRAGVRRQHAPPPAASPTGTRSPHGLLRPHPQDRAMQLEEIQGPPSGQLTVQGGAGGPLTT